MSNTEFKGGHHKRNEPSRGSIKFFKPGELTAERDNSSDGNEIRLGYEDFNENQIDSPNSDKFNPLNTYQQRRFNQQSPELSSVT